MARWMNGSMRVALDPVLRTRHDSGQPIYSIYSIYSIYRAGRQVHKNRSRDVVEKQINLCGSSQWGRSLNPRCSPVRG